MTGLKTMGNGNHKCLFCNHKSYKRLADALAHIQDKHALELANATVEEMRGEITRLKKQPPKVVEKERIVYRDPPAEKKKEYWYVRNYGLEGIYCTACKQVQTGVGIPVGQTIENTPHSCGNRTLLPVVEVR